MLTSPPSFFDDVGRHGWGVAWSKKRTTYAVGGQYFRYGDLAGWNWQQLLWLLNQAIADGNKLCICWAFEWLLIQAQGDVARTWQAVLPVLSNHQEPTALAAIDQMLKYVPDPNVLTNVEHGAWPGYLVGRTFGDRAQKKTSKSDLQTNKKLALHFLGNARTRLEWERQQPSADPYRAAAMAAAVGVAVAAAYAGVAYLQWKGTRTTALAE
jgi:hypothetical protein